MCGIAGIIDFKGSSDLKNTLKKMTDSLSHRGPDGEGIWVNDLKTISLGHRRLSIIDLSEAGNQPMHYAERYTIVFNGEIYNYVEIRNQLMLKGIKFNSNSDTEVLLALYHEKKENCLSFLDGMFSFVIYDSVDNSIFAARDRFGEKPFYYVYSEDRLFFASEIKAFWAASLEKNVDNEMLFYYLNYSQIHHPFDNSKTFFRNVTKLKPGCYFKMNLTKKESIKQIQYWNLEDTRVKIYDKWNQSDIVDKFYTLFEQSVLRRLRSDVPVGSSLSGGLDSSAIVCMINEVKKNVNQKQATFSARFPGFVKDEGHFMNAVINQTNTSSYFTFPEKDGFLNSFDTMCFHQDEPFGSASIYAQFEVMRLAKECNITVLLDGQGADEMLGGYSYYRDSVSDGQLLKLLFRQTNNINVNSKKQVLKSTIKRNFPIFINAYRNYSDLLNKSSITSPFQKEFLYTIGKVKQPYQTHDDLYKHLKHDLLYGNLEDLLRYADRNSMAHSREVRLPFLNHELVEFTMALPDSLKINGEWTKYIQRLAFERILPKEITWRKDKIGYEPPQKEWMEDSRIKEKIMESKKVLFKNQIISKVEADKIPGSASANAKGDNSWNYLMTSVLF
ncbi:MAG: asparagine synthase (glutamine-hydrolyzing) [Sphingobacteriia bacterium]|jgi:asparagine synthase (glutamine-hydrolysing)